MGRTIVEKEETVNKQEAPQTLFQPADDGIGSAEADINGTNVSGVMNFYEDQLIKFVSEQVTKMDQKLLFDGNSSPPLPLIDKAIMQHEHVTMALTALYEQARCAWNTAKEAYAEWHAIKFLEIRMEVNKKEDARAKWFKDTEIEYMIIAKYTKEVADFKARIQLADAKVSLFRRLIDSWNQYAFQLGQLSRNGIAEKNSSDMTDKYEDQDPVDTATLALAAMGQQ
jgi:hypothetical protein